MVKARSKRPWFLVSLVALSGVAIACLRMSCLRIEQLRKYMLGDLSSKTAAISFTCPDGRNIRLLVALPLAVRCFEGYERTTEVVEVPEDWSSTFKLVKKGETVAAVVSQKSDLETCSWLEDDGFRSFSLDWSIDWDAILDAGETYEINVSSTMELPKGASLWLVSLE
jgi:hypothetical protein